MGKDQHDAFRYLCQRRHLIAGAALAVVMPVEGEGQPLQNARDRLADMAGAEQQKRRQRHAEHFQHPFAGLRRLTARTDRGEVSGGHQPPLQPAGIEQGFQMMPARRSGGGDPIGLGRLQPLDQQPHPTAAALLQERPQRIILDAPIARRLGQRLLRLQDGLEFEIAAANRADRALLHHQHPGPRLARRRSFDGQH
jgi:hypothetical protein